MSDNYMTSEELEGVKVVLDTLNEAFTHGSNTAIGLGAFKVYDTNGEPIGIVAMNESRVFVLYGPEYDPDDV